MPLLVLLVASSAAPLSAGDDDLEILQFLAGTGADPDGTCRARWRQDEDSTGFDVELEQMDAGDYEVWVGGTLRGELTVDGTGEGDVEFKTPQDGDKPLLDFDVLDQLVEVKQGATTFFSDTFDGSGSGGGGGGGSGGAASKIEVFMVNVGPDGNAQGRLRHELKGAKRRFDLEVENLDGGVYQLLVDGAPVAEFMADGFETEIEFQDPVEAGKVLLNFEPLGAQVDVVSGGEVYLTAVMPAAGTGAPAKGKKGAQDTGKKQGDGLLVVLLNSGLVPAANGKAKLEVSGETEFEVEFEDVPAGDYDLVVGGIVRGSAPAVEGAGEFRFSTSPLAGEELLDFTVQGQLVEVTDGVDTLLSTVFPVSVQAALGTWKKEIHDVARVKVNLVASGLDLDARGVLDFKDKASKDTLVVSVFDLPAGSYDLVVDGVPQEDVLVVTKADGKAKVTFDTQPKGKKLLLDFAVVGLVVQVTPSGDNGSVLLEALVE
ncbi:MAG: hypothetical protein FJ296_06895 [Planctomycetes bacterium]|nr:hypothetical protein [Planctomycetota bacterium]